jgi:K(+)-stimulated pyrophosphate-energized sodium pump
MLIIYFPLVVSLFIFAFVSFLAISLFRQAASRQQGREFVRALYDGIISYAKRQYRLVGIIVILLFFLFLVVMGWRVAFGFLLGSGFSAVMVCLPMVVSLETSTRLAQSSQKGLSPVFDMLYRGGVGVGLFAASLSLLVISSYYFLTGLGGLIALAFGVGLVALLFRLSGAIQAKASHLAVELTRKREKHNGDEPVLHPMMIALHMGRLVGDLASTSLDIFETYCLGMILVMVLGALLYPKSPQFVLLPLFLASIFLLTSLVGSFFARLSKSKNILMALYRGMGVAMILSLIALYPLIANMMAEQIVSVTSLYLCCLAGLLMAAGILLFVEYYISKKYGPTKNIIQAHQKGQSFNMMQLFGLVMQSTAVPVLLIVMGAIAGFLLAGAYGVALAGFSMLSIVPMLFALNFYGPTAGQASVIVGMLETPQVSLKTIDDLQAPNAFLKIIVSSYTITSAALVTLVMFWAYSQKVADEIGSSMANFDLADLRVVAGLLIGAALSYAFIAFLAAAVGRAANRASTEFKKYKDYQMEAGGAPHSQSITLSETMTIFSIRGMAIPVLLPLLIPVIVGGILGAEALGGLLIGSLVTGLFLAMVTSLGSALWSGSKKYLEEGSRSGFGNQIAALSESSRETMGLAINAMIKIIGLVSLLIIVFLV